jgi:hypothetical protein
MNLWVSNGDTSSMLHRDGFNQLNCVVRGSKLWTTIDATHIPDIPFIWEDGVDPLFVHGGVVHFNWDEIDFEEYPKLASIPYKRAVVREGDCIFIPGDYPHHVISPAPGEPTTERARNLQVSFLFGGPTAYARGTRREVPPLPWQPTPTAPGCSNNMAGGSAGKDGINGGEGSGNNISVPLLSNHPVYWVYPGLGPSTLGSFDLHTLKQFILRTHIGERPWEQFEDEDEGRQYRPTADDVVVESEKGDGEGSAMDEGESEDGVADEDEPKGKGNGNGGDDVDYNDDASARPDVTELELPRSTTEEECTASILTLGTHVMRPDKGFAGHDLIQLAEYVDLVLRDPVHNAGPWSKWEPLVVEIPALHGMYHLDTVVIPGLRAELLAVLEKQAHVVCESMTDATSNVIAAGSWLTLPQHMLSKQLVALVSIFNMADSSRYANYVGQTIGGEWRGVRGPDGNWGGSQPDNADDDEDGDMGDADGNHLPEPIEHHYEDEEDEMRHHADWEEHEERMHEQMHAEELEHHAAEATALEQLRLENEHQDMERRMAEEMHHHESEMHHDRDEF